MRVPNQNAIAPTCHSVTTSYAVATASRGHSWSQPSTPPTGLVNGAEP